MDIDCVQSTPEQTPTQSAELAELALSSPAESETSSKLRNSRTSISQKAAKLALESLALLEERKATNPDPAETGLGQQFCQPLRLLSETETAGLVRRLNSCGLEVEDLEVNPNALEAAHVAAMAASMAASASHTARRKVQSNHLEEQFGKGASVMRSLPVQLKQEGTAQPHEESAWQQREISTCGFEAIFFHLEAQIEIVEREHLMMLGAEDLIERCLGEAAVLGQGSEHCGPGSEVSEAQLVVQRQLAQTETPQERVMQIHALQSKVLHLEQREQKAEAALAEDSTVMDDLLLSHSEEMQVVEQLRMNLEGHVEASKRLIAAEETLSEKLSAAESQVQEVESLKASQIARTEAANVDEVSKLLEQLSSEACLEEEETAHELQSATTSLSIQQAEILEAKGRERQLQLQIHQFPTRLDEMTNELKHARCASAKEVATLERSLQDADKRNLYMEEALDGMQSEAAQSCSSLAALESRMAAESRLEMELSAARSSADAEAGEFHAAESELQTEMATLEKLHASRSWLEANLVECQLSSAARVELHTAQSNLEAELTASKSFADAEVMMLSAVRTKLELQESRQIGALDGHADLRERLAIAEAAAHDSQVYAGTLEASLERQAESVRRQSERDGLWEEQALHEMRERLHEDLEKTNKNVFRGLEAAARRREVQLEIVSQELAEVELSKRAARDEMQEMRFGAAPSKNNAERHTRSLLSLRQMSVRAAATDNEHIVADSHLLESALIRIQELEKQAARHRDDAETAAALFTPKIQQLVDEVGNHQIELQLAHGSQHSLREDVAQKAQMVRELVRQNNLLAKEVTRLNAASSAPESSDAAKEKKSSVLKKMFSFTSNTRPAADYPVAPGGISMTSAQVQHMQDLEECLQRATVELAELRGDAQRPQAVAARRQDSDSD